ncbi:hypothetical protein FHT44_000533 [Mycolicibacterium sp. BK634]|nr:hypothetical protein [Mycolicibacterium sp. BK634]
MNTGRTLMPVGLLAVGISLADLDRWEAGSILAVAAEGPRVGGNVTSFPALEVYSDRNGATTPLLQTWPSYTDDASGPMVGLLPHKDVGDPMIITSFNSVIPQIEPPQLEPVHGPQAVPITPPLSIVPPGQLHPLRTSDCR